MNQNARNSINKDMYRYFARNETTKEKLLRVVFGLWRDRTYMIVFRKYQASKHPFIKYYYLLRLNRLSNKTHIQIPASTKIGDGFYIGHCGRIIINPRSILGQNINIATGVVIGQTNRGKKKGCPTIGDEVWIGANSVIVGNINIGNDVLIAPNTYVNIDIPSHSIVFGNPAQIHPRSNATEHYINNKI